MQNEINNMKDRISHIDELENKCGLLQRSIQILSKENKWEYSTCPKPDSYWIERGFDEDYIDSMKELMSEIIRNTIRLRKKECIEYITLGVASPDNDVGTLLQYDDALLPHWKEFTTALQLHHDNNVQFTIQNLQLSHSVISMLVPALKVRLKMLLLDNNGFDDRKGIEFLVTCMQSNRQMNEFYLTNNQLGGMENARSVLDAVTRHPSIEHVRLENCLGGDINGYNILCSLLASGKQFDTIDFDRNNIHTKGGTAIPDYIANNTPLKSLFLSGNKLNDNDAILIASALKSNSKLEDLHLYRNDFTCIGREALLKAAYDTTSLNSVYNCNHSCQIQISMEDGSVVGRGLPSFCKNVGENLPLTSILDPKSIRSRKMHYILTSSHREGSNVQHLNTEFKDDDEDSLKLAPKVLEAVYKHSNKRRDRRIPPLSIMYEILRGWKMPELYGNR